MASKAYRGQWASGTPIITVEQGKVYQGQWASGTPIATIESGGRMTGAAAAVFLLLM